MPVLPHPDFKGKTRNGFFADVLAQTDAYIGDLLDGMDSLGLRDNTIFIFTSDNGPEMRQPWQGFSGPWGGTFFTGMEASLRVSFIIRWPGKVPAGAVNNEIVHEMDLFTTFAHIAGGKVPQDRIIDGVDQTDFFMGKGKSKREAFVVYVGPQIFGVKWRNWKLMTKGLVRGTDPIDEWGHSRVINLLSNPKEEPLLANEEQTFWVRWPAGQVLAEHLESLKKEPPIEVGTPDPYTPPASEMSGADGTAGYWREKRYQQLLGRGLADVLVNGPGAATASRAYPTGSPMARSDTTPKGESCGADSPRITPPELATRTVRTS